MKKWEIAITNDQISLDEIIKSATSHLYNWRSYMAKLDSMEQCLLDLQWNNWTCKVIHVAAGNKSFRKQDVNGYTTLEWFYSLKLSIVQFFGPSQFQTFFFFFLVRLTGAMSSQIQKKSTAQFFCSLSDKTERTSMSWNNLTLCHLTFESTI